MDLTQKQRKLARDTIGLAQYDHPPVVCVPNDSLPPMEVGESYYHTTLSGKTIVRYPSAYGWPTLYHPSTRRILVGENWFSREAA